MIRLALACAVIAAAVPPGTRVDPNRLAAQPHPLSSRSFGGHVMSGAPPSRWPPVAHGTVRTWDARGVQWPDLEPSPGERHWEALDALVEQARAQDAQVVYTFGRVPRWAAVDPAARCAFGPGQCSPPRPEAFARFVHAVATRYGARIFAWELWNEPNSPDFFSGDLDALVRTVSLASAELRKVLPSARILSPAPTDDTGPLWFGRFLHAGGRATFDVAAFHCYPRAQLDQLVDRVAAYRNALVGAGLAATPLWCTEGGWGRNDSHYSRRWGGDAAYLAKLHLVLFASGVERVLWYAWNNRLWGTLLAEEGERPAAAAYRRLQGWLVGATLGPCSVKGQTWRCALSAGGTSGEIVWSDARAPGPLAFPAPRRCEDVLGRVRTVSALRPTPVPTWCR